MVNIFFLLTFFLLCESWLQGPGVPVPQVGRSRLEQCLYRAIRELFCEQISVEHGVPFTLYHAEHCSRYRSYVLFGPPLQVSNSPTRIHAGHCSGYRGNALFGPRLQVTNCPIRIHAHRDQHDTTQEKKCYVGKCSKWNGQGRGQRDLRTSWRRWGLHATSMEWSDLGKRMNKASINW